MLTGASGFIGSHLVRRLIHCGCRVSLLVRPSSNLWRLQDLLDRLDIRYDDLTNLSLNPLDPELSDVKFIYHMAAYGVNQALNDVPVMMQTNVMGTWELLRLARRWKVERFVYCGSCFEYGPGDLLSEKAVPNPSSEYGVSKSSAWMLVNMFHRIHGVPVVSLRPFTTYGPFEARYRLIPQVVNCVLEGQDVQLTGGKQKRDFIFIDDVIDAFLLAATCPDIDGETFNISTGLVRSVEEVVLTIIELMHGRIKPLFGLVEYNPSELWVSSGNPCKAEKRLGWSSQISFQDGLRKTIEWFVDHRTKYPEYCAKK